MSHLPKKRCRSRFGLGDGKHRKDRQSIFAEDKMDTSDVVDIPTENIDTHFGLAPGPLMKHLFLCLTLISNTRLIQLLLLMRA